MSRQLISRSDDLSRLRREGFEIEVRAGHLVMTHVPYLNAERRVCFGTLVSTLTVAGQVTSRPGDHVVHFAGEPPCDVKGALLTKIINSNTRQDLGGGLVVDMSFSSKPSAGYADYYEKMSTYAAILSSQAQAVDPGVTAKTGRAVPSEGDEETAFLYLDTASTRAGIGAASERLRGLSIGIVGVGGTGSYVLDMVAKTHVANIHLYDEDGFAQHNAFRAPGAASLDDVSGAAKKVDHWASEYSRMRTGVVAHPYRIDGESVDKLSGHDFVFLCMDSGDQKRVISEHLEASGIPFVDVGMGVQLGEAGRLCGILRVTLSTPTERRSFHRRVNFADSAAEDPYESNIQLAELNALNAALAVIKWKKLFEFYGDEGREHSVTYTIDGNMLLNEDREDECE